MAEKWQPVHTMAKCSYDGKKRQLVHTNVRRMAGKWQLVYANDKTNGRKMAAARNSVNGYARKGRGNGNRASGFTSGRCFKRKIACLL